MFNMIFRCSETVLETFEDLIRKWSKFVKEVESGYTLTIYDYTNDLSVRDILQKIIDQSTDQQKSVLLNRLKDIDDKFISETEEIKKEIPFGGHSSWWRRTPKKLMGELLEDFKNENLV